MRFTRFFCLCLLTILITACGKEQIIVHSLEEKEANEILVFLASRDIEVYKTAHKSSGGGAASKVDLYDLNVKGDRAVEAMGILSMNGLPRKKGLTLLEVFAKGGLVSSESEERIRYVAALAENVAGTIRKIDGILEVDIQLSFPKKSDDSLDQGKATASVFVKHQGILNDPNAHLEAKIKRLVASAITDLDLENVTVIGTKTRFTDLSLQRIVDRISGDREYQKIWSIVVAKESAKTFRVIFLIFVLKIFFLFFSICWILWRVAPLLKDQGGFSYLLSLRPPAEKKELQVEKKVSNEQEFSGDDEDFSDEEDEDDDDFLEGDDDFSDEDEDED